MLTGGLGRTDLGRPETVGGIFREYLNRIVAHYERHFGNDSPQVRDCLGGQRFEPQAARAVFSAMIAEAGVEVRTQRSVARDLTGPDSITHVILTGPEGEERVSARTFVDASYEGDLLAAAGCDYRVGRESRAEYGEEYAGHLFWDPKTARPTADGTGEGDKRIQAYCFRLTVTDDPENRLPIARPSDYDASRYELLRAYLQAAPRQLKDVLLLGKLPNSKWDVNNWGFCWQSMDKIEGNSDYPEATWERRREIAGAHRQYQWGLLYFLQHDSSVPADLREEAGRFGLCRDEFVESGGWPEQLYLREARRLVGRAIFTERDARQETGKPDAVAVGSYPMDSHGTQWYRIGQTTPAPEGFFMVSLKPYEIPWGCLLPKSPHNVLVPVCLSASHAGYGTLRMEPVMMNLGMACGIAAAMAKEGNTTPCALDPAELQQALAQAGQVVSAR